MHRVFTRAPNEPMTHIPLQQWFLNDLCYGLNIFLVLIASWSAGLKRRRSAWNEAHAS